MTQTPPNYYCPTPPEERRLGKTYVLVPQCPWCESDLELRDRVSWIRDCPECPYMWVDAVRP